MNFTKIVVIAGDTVVSAIFPAAAAQTAVMSSASTPLSSKDQAFLSDAASGSNYKIQVAELGAQKGTVPEIRAYADALILQHAAYTSSMLNLANVKGIVLPTGSASGDTDKVNALARRSGTDFDRAFLQEELRVNQQDVAQERGELAATPDPSLQAFVRQYMAGDEFHMNTAQQLLSHVGS